MCRQKATWANCSKWVPYWVIRDIFRNKLTPCKLRWKSRYNFIPNSESKFSQSRWGRVRLSCIYYSVIIKLLMGSAIPLHAQLPLISADAWHAETLNELRDCTNCTKLLLCWVFSSLNESIWLFKNVVYYFDLKPRISRLPLVIVACHKIPANESKKWRMKAIWGLERGRSKDSGSNYYSNFEWTTIRWWGPCSTLIMFPDFQRWKQKRTIYSYYF